MSEEKSSEATMKAMFRLLDESRAQTKRIEAQAKEIAELRAALEVSEACNRAKTEAFLDAMGSGKVDGDGKPWRFFCLTPCPHCTHSGCDAQEQWERHHPSQAAG